VRTLLRERFSQGGQCHPPKLLLTGAAIEIRGSLRRA
jgi:hypothetical protein